MNDINYLNIMGKKRERTNLKEKKKILDDE